MMIACYLSFIPMAIQFFIIGADVNLRVASVDRSSHPQRDRAFLLVRITQIGNLISGVFSAERSFDYGTDRCVFWLFLNNRSGQAATVEHSSLIYVVLVKPILFNCPNTICRLGMLRRNLRINFLEPTVHLRS